MTADLTRRHLLFAAAGSALAGVALAQPATLPSTRRADQPGHILILGGTGFLGPHQVRYALARGHKVTIANRGRTRPDLFDDRENVDEIVIDREGDLAELEQAIKDGRRWDAVIDNSGYVPAHVTATAELLKDAADLYLFVSTISVYGSAIDKVGADESYPVETVSDERANAVTRIRDVGMLYGPLKARCETAAAQAFGEDRTISVRPGLIAGPGDTTDRFTYWPVRVGMSERCDGKMIQSGTADEPQPLQTIDVRDLAQFCVKSCEQKTSGTYNAVAPTARLDDAVNAAMDWYKANGKATAEPVRMPASFLEEQGVAFWQEMPGIVPGSPETAGFATVSNAAAVGVGLTNRTIAETTTATLDWWQTLPADRTATLRAGISPERESKVLEAWAAR